MTTQIKLSDVKNRTPFIASNEKNNIDWVPIELIKYIFSLLNSRDLTRAGLVCKKWKEIVTQDPRILGAQNQFDKNLLFLNGGERLISPLSYITTSLGLYTHISRLPNVMPRVIESAKKTSYQKPLGNDKPRLINQRIFYFPPSIRTPNHNIECFHYDDILTGKQVNLLFTDSFGTPLKKEISEQEPLFYPSPERLIALFDEKLHVWDLSTGNYRPAISLPKFPPLNDSSPSNIKQDDIKAIFLNSSTFYIFRRDDNADRVQLDIYDLDSQLFSESQTWDGNLCGEPKILFNKYLFFQIDIKPDNARKIGPFYFNLLNTGKQDNTGTKSSVYLMSFKDNKVKQVLEHPENMNWRFYERDQASLFLLSSKEIIIYHINTDKFENNPFKSPLNIFCAVSFHQFLIISAEFEGKYFIYLYDSENHALTTHLITRDNAPIEMFVLGHLLCTRSNGNVDVRNLLLNGTQLKILDLAEVLIMNPKIEKLQNELNQMMKSSAISQSQAKSKLTKKKIDSIPISLQGTLSTYLKNKKSNLDWLADRKKMLDNLSESLVRYVVQENPTLTLTDLLEKEIGKEFSDFTLGSPQCYFKKIAYFLIRNNTDKVQELMSKLKTRYPNLYKEFFIFTNQDESYFFNGMKTNVFIRKINSVSCLNFLKFKKLGFIPKILEHIKKVDSPLSYFEALGETKDSLSKETHISKGNLQKCGILTVEDLESLSITPEIILELHELSLISSVFDPNQSVEEKRKALSSLIYRLEKILKIENTFIEDLTKIIDNGNDKLYTEEYIEKSLKKPLEDFCQKIEEEIKNLKNIYQTPKLLKETTGQCEKLKDIFSELLRLEIIRQKAIADLYLKQTGIENSWNIKRGVAESLSEFQKLTDYKNSVADLLKFDTEVQAAPSKRSNNEQNEKSSKRTRTS